jgi:hypothetical protein
MSDVSKQTMQRPNLFRGQIGKLTTSAAILLIAGLHATWPQVFDQFVVLLLLIALSPWLLPLFSRHLRSAEAFGAKVEFLESKLEVESRRVDDLFLLSLGDKLLNHLRKLGQSTGYGPAHVGTALPRELEYLENLGYIRFRLPLRGLDDFQGTYGRKNVQNLSDCIELTDAGKMFLRLREEAASGAARWVARLSQS